MIFSRVLRFKIDAKLTKIRSWKLKFDFGGQKLAKMSILEAKKTILEAKKAVLEAKRPILEVKMAKLIFYVDFLGTPAERARPLAEPESGDLKQEHVTIPHA